MRRFLLSSLSTLFRLIQTKVSLRKGGERTIPIKATPINGNHQTTFRARKKTDSPKAWHMNTVTELRRQTTQMTHAERLHDTNE
jgi:hypothetical protein